MTSEPLCARGRADRFSILATSFQLEYNLPLFLVQEGILRFSDFFFSSFVLCNCEVEVNMV